MAEKIGEVLIQEGLITQAELEEALKSQVIYGGKLGTNLVEMGLLSEDDFGQILSKTMRVPYVGADELRDISPIAIAAMPADLAEKFKVVPLRLENRRLTLVMADPSDLGVMDEISFRTGFLIRPLVTSELALAHALEKYYDVARQIRYIALQRTVPKVRSKPVLPNPAVNLTTPSPAGVSPVKASLPSPSSGKQQKAAPAVAGGVKEPASLSVVADGGTVLTATTAAVSEQDATDFFAEMGISDTLPITLETMAQRLILAADREDIAAAAIGWLGSHFQRSALFLVRGEMATGWHAVSAREMISGFDRLRIPLTEPSVLKTVADSHSMVLGPLQRTPFNSQLLQELGGEIPETALLLPLLMLGRITAILYLEDQDKLLRENDAGGSETVRQDDHGLRNSDSEEQNNAALALLALRR